jgi:phosphoribosyl-ATP pyrophosphohydrolase/phosphoribosyl-AMP cyclohydrolase/histidinol dehydrogenase
MTAPLHSDRPDGLISTVVVNERRQLLGLVYSSRESIKEAVKRKKGIYQSRKRGLWFKGETSGATQELLQILPDCDRDAVCFVVHQHGDGFCHLNRFSCFETETGLSHLSKTLEERKQNAPAGSYTHRLLNDDALLNAKILEEAKELVDATDKDEITWEAADVIYFALVKAYKHGITLDDIEAELDKRSLKVTRRQGDAKPQFLSAVTSSTTSTQTSEESEKK